MFFFVRIVTKSAVAIQQYIAGLLFLYLQMCPKLVF